MRYEEYSHHMYYLIHSFEAIAGTGAGKSYTALALLAMSKHFCRLRNAILAQIHTTKHKLLKDTQFSLFHQESRSIHAWRPIRGLPETCVTILRAWLFGHFLHPYPNDSEKLMLASQTGLSKNQVDSSSRDDVQRLFWIGLNEPLFVCRFRIGSSMLESGCGSR